MKYKEFGNTGMRISQITLGTWGMGDVGWDHYDESTRVDAIRTAVENGINLIDTPLLCGRQGVPQGRFQGECPQAV